MPAWLCMKDRRGVVVLADIQRKKEKWHTKCENKQHALTRIKRNRATLSHSASAAKASLYAVCLQYISTVLLPSCFPYFLTSFVVNSLLSPFCFFYLLVSCAHLLFTFAFVRIEGNFENFRIFKQTCRKHILIHTYLETYTHVPMHVCMYESSSCACMSLFHSHAAPNQACLHTYIHLCCLFTTDKMGIFAFSMLWRVAA